MNGAKLQAADLTPLLDRLARRGPDGSNMWVGDWAALGHTLLATTPESAVEKLPLQHVKSGCTITADVRLDNRDDLFAKLRLGSADRLIGDGELILLAYLRWGDNCVDHLLGDFAFAIWDSRLCRLLCARDHLGMRQLTYCQVPGGAFLFATEPAAVLRHSECPKALNEERIADFLDGLEGFDLSATFFDAVFRLPAAHCLSFGAGGVRLWKYWSLETPPELQLASDREYEEAFLNVFTEAVSCRLRSPGPVGATLSGGMDSGSVAAIAAQILADRQQGPLATFSAVALDPTTCVETRAIHAATMINGIDPRLICLSDLGEYREELIQLSGGCEPFDGQMTMLRAVYLTAHRNGLKVILDGGAGDIVCGPHSHLANLLRQLRLVSAWREARGERQFWGPQWPVWRALSTAAGRAWVPRSLRAARRWIARSLRDHRRGSTSSILANISEHSKPDSRRKEKRLRNSPINLGQDERAQRINHAYLIVGRERYDRVASAVAIEPRDPFMDLRVIRFCLALPSNQLQANGWPKILLRRAMAGKLPAEVRWRRGKEHLGWEFTNALYTTDETVLSQRRLHEALEPYVLNSVLADFDETDCEKRLDRLHLYHWLMSEPVRCLPPFVGVRNPVLNAGSIPRT